MIQSSMSQQKNRFARKRLYISGPLTSSGDPESNVQKAIAVWHALLELGYAPLCPHLSWYIDPNAKIKHAVWMEVDLPWVSVSDGVFRIPGSSNGADQECREAFNRGIPVFKSLKELESYQW